METLFFFLGILATVLVIFIAMVVVGTRKLLRLEQAVTNLDRSLYQSLDSVYMRINSVETELQRQVERVSADCYKLHDEQSAYIDSRIDKLEDKLTSNKQKSA